MIDGNVLIEHVYPLLPEPKAVSTINFNKPNESDVNETKPTTDEVKNDFTIKVLRSKPTQLTDADIADSDTYKRAIFKLADALFARNLTLLELIHDSKEPYTSSLDSPIIDKTIDGVEYQLIKRSDLDKKLDILEIKFDEKEQQILNGIFIPKINDLVDVKIILEILEKLGIKEDKAISSKQLPFDILQGECIRIFNRIIKYMRNNKIGKVVSMLPKRDIDSITVVAKDGEHVIQTIHAIKLRDILRSKGIIPYGEELNDQFVDFLQLSYNHDNLIVIKKFEKAINKIKYHKYYHYFGYKQRKFTYAVTNLLNAHFKATIENPKVKSDKNIKRWDRDPEIYYTERVKVSGIIEQKIRMALEKWRYTQLYNRRIKDNVNRAKEKFKDLVRNKQKFNIDTELEKFLEEGKSDFHSVSQFDNTSDEEYSNESFDRELESPKYMKSIKNRRKFGLSLRRRKHSRLDMHHY